MFVREARFRVNRRSVAGCAAAMAVLLPMLPGTAAGEVPAALTGSPVPVKASPTLAEQGPAADGSWLVWSHNSRRKPRWSNSFAQSGSGLPVRLNERGTQGTTGGVDGDRAAYTQWSERRGIRRGKVYVFNLATGNRRPLPAKVSGDGSSDATISGRWFLYSREYVYPGAAVVSHVMLYNRHTHELRRVAAGSYRTVGVFPGQVNGRWAVWSDSWESASHVFRYNVVTKAKERIAGDDTSFVFDPAVSSDGTMYFLRVRSGITDLVRLPVGGTETVLAQMSGYVSDLFVMDQTDGSRVVFFQSAAGIRKQSDLYQIVDN